MEIVNHSATTPTRRVDTRGWTEQEIAAFKAMEGTLAALRRMPETWTQARRFEAKGFGHIVRLSDGSRVWMPAGAPETESRRRGPHRAPRGVK